MQGRITKRKELCKKQNSRNVQREPLKSLAECLTGLCIGSLCTAWESTATGGCKLTEDLEAAQDKEIFEFLVIERRHRADHLGHSVETQEGHALEGLL